MILLLFFFIFSFFQKCEREEKQIQKPREDLAQWCLQICLPRFDGLVTTLNTQVRPQPLSFEEFCVLLMEEELRLKARDGGSNDQKPSTPLCIVGTSYYDIPTSIISVHQCGVKGMIPQPWYLGTISLFPQLKGGLGFQIQRYRVELCQSSFFFKA